MQADYHVGDGRCYEDCYEDCYINDQPLSSVILAQQTKRRLLLSEAAAAQQQQQALNVLLPINHELLNLVVEAFAESGLSSENLKPCYGGHRTLKCRWFA